MTVFEAAFGLSGWSAVRRWRLESRISPGLVGHLASTCLSGSSLDFECPVQPDLPPERLLRHRCPLPCRVFSCRCPGDSEAVNRQPVPQIDVPFLSISMPSNIPIELSNSNSVTSLPEQVRVRLTLRPAIEERTTPEFLPQAHLPLSSR